MNDIKKIAAALHAIGRMSRMKSVTEAADALDALAAQQSAGVDQLESAWRKGRDAWMKQTRHGTQESADKAALEAMRAVLAPQPAPPQPAVPESFEKALDAALGKQCLYDESSDAKEKERREDRDAARAEVLRLYALAAAPAVTWQPIETAPKDGTELLIFDPVDGPARAHWSTHNWYAGTYVAAPTHWMPLPAPPALNAAPEPGK